MSGPIAGQYIVTLHEGVLPDEFIQQFASGFRIRNVYRRVLNGFAVNMPESAADGLRKNPMVKSVSIDWEADSAMTPITDTIPGWGLERIYRPDIGAIALTDRTYKQSWSKDGAGVSAYIIDQGYPRQHVDFEGNLIQQGYLPPDVSASGMIEYHAHAVSSTFIGRYSGVARRASMTWSMAFNSSDAIAAADWIVLNHPGGPAVVNMSLGWYITNADGTKSPNHEPEVDAALQNMINEGFLFCCSAGNEDFQAGTHTPTSVDDAIVVGGMNEWGMRAKSCWGPDVDIWAPGNAIVTAIPDGYDTYGISTGTSFASPLVAGACAVIWSDNPTWTRVEVETELINRSTKGAILSMDATDNNRLLYVGPQTSGQIHSHYTTSAVNLVPTVYADAIGSMVVTTVSVTHTSGAALVATSGFTVTGGIAVTDKIQMKTYADLDAIPSVYSTFRTKLDGVATSKVIGEREVVAKIRMLSRATFRATELTGIQLRAKASASIQGTATALSAMRASGVAKLYAYVATTIKGSAALRGLSDSTIVAESYGQDHSEMNATSFMSVSAVVGAKTVIVNVVDTTKPTILGEGSDIVMTNWQIRRTGIKGRGANV